MKLYEDLKEHQHKLLKDMNSDANPIQKTFNKLADQHKKNYEEAGIEVDDGTQKLNFKTDEL